MPGWSVMGRSEKVRFGAALAVAVLVPGLTHYALSAAGYEALGSVVWFTGYLTAMVAIWYIWIRPLDFRGTTE
ncbi:hypothetical protein NGM10_12490 [Halorussus salilacus]|uniref:hypothetical protein n=1 Tax=Halorussus salilacus TaxID=2953750 RepID=UPI00209DD451|nr:hypothetical protein [Halorussus salilacus]USZ67542.1 hypothetical protein NGM10_12490 [Halorussus salilacus]